MRCCCGTLNHAWPGSQIEEHFCSRILEIISQKIETKQSSSDIYREISLLVSKSDNQHIVSFNPSPKDRAVLKIVSWRILKLITDEQMSMFSEKTRLAIEAENHRLTRTHPADVIQDMMEETAESYLMSELCLELWGFDEQSALR